MIKYIKEHKMVYTIGMMRNEMTNIPYNSRVIIIHRDIEYIVGEILGVNAVFILTGRLITEQQRRYMGIDIESEMRGIPETRIMRVRIMENGRFEYYDIREVDMSRMNEEGVVILRI